MLKLCNACEYGKAHRKPIKKEHKALKAAKIGAEVHSNIWGPSPVQTMGGREYNSTYTDNHLCFTRLCLQCLKSKIFQFYKQYKAFLLHQKGVHIKKLRAIHGGEYLSKEFSTNLAKAGAIQNLTVHNMLEHNDVAERFNCTLLERV
jgi:hypothetical protein